MNTVHYVFEININFSIFKIPFCIQKLKVFKYSVKKAKR